MTALPAIPTMLWHAMPPELNTGRLMAGAGPAPMLQAAAGWEAFAILLETQADELMASLAALTSAWSGSASERAVSATMPMVVWLRTTSMQAQKRAMQAIAQANSYALALATTPPLVEIEQNHITHGILEGTNFFGINTIPIGLNEADYLIRMWNQAAFVMDAYQMETTANTLFEPILPMTPIVIPGVGEGTASGAIGQVAAMAPGAAMREASFAHVGAQATVESIGLITGNMVSQANMAATRGEGAAQRAQNAQQNPMQQGAQQGVQMATQMASQLGSTLIQLPQQATQMVSQPMQQLMAPMQQLTSMFSGAGSDKAQMGLMGASPLSNHPLAGGSGLSSGAGLVRAASVPGAGGTMSRTPMMANLIGNTEMSPKSMPGAGAGSNTAGLAPVGSGSGSPGMMGHNKKDGGSRPGLQTPTLLAYDTGEDEEDDW
nr:MULTISPECIES: PPE family protein [unclassified Mycobacterium]